MGTENKENLKTAYTAVECQSFPQALRLTTTRTSAECRAKRRNGEMGPRQTTATAPATRPLPLLLLLLLAESSRGKKRQQLLFFGRHQTLVLAFVLVLHIRNLFVHTHSRTVAHS